MNNRNKIFIALLVVILLLTGIGVWFVSFQSTNRVQSLNGKRPSASESKKQTAIDASNPSGTNALLPHTEKEKQDAKKRYEEEIRIREESVKSTKEQFRTPIIFYGKVIDENDQPVVGAEIKYSCNSIDVTLTQEVHYDGKVYSDASGMFKIDGIRGIDLGFQLSHPDYYNSVKNRTLVGYARGRDPNVPETPEAAWIFRMYKKKNPIAMVSGSGGVKVPPNGTPGIISCGKYGRLQAEYLGNPPPTYTGKPFEWLVRLSVPNGGIMEAGPEFNFEAPMSGYQPFIEINMKNTQQGWVESVRKNYFISFGQNFSRMNIYVNSGKEAFVSIDYLINPTLGDRNLESDPKKVIRQ